MTNPPPHTLISYSLTWPETSLIAFLRQTANSPRIYWENGQTTPAFSGYGLAATMTADGSSRFQTIQQQAARLFAGAIIEADNAPGWVMPRLFGGFSFRAEARAYGIWSAFPSAHFVLPNYQLTCFEGQTWLTVNHCPSPGENPNRILKSLRTDIQNLRLALEMIGGNIINPLAELRRPKMHLEIDYPMDYEEWQQLISNTTKKIKQGKLDKVVLARVCRVLTSRLVEPADILIQLKRNYPNCYRFLIEPIPGHAFYGATPEILAEVKDMTIQTTALAGSIKRGQTEEEDRRLGQELLASNKERQEHTLVIETIEKNLTPLTTDLHISPKPSLLRLSNIQHLETTIQGKLSSPCGVLPVVKTLHPTPAMGGSPLDVAMHVIGEGESFSRGWYASPVGWLDPQGNGLFAVAIRSAISVGHETYLFAGAGIVADSDPQKEWQETKLKFRPIMDALKESANE